MKNHASMSLCKTDTMLLEVYCRFIIMCLFKIFLKAKFTTRAATPDGRILVNIKLFDPLNPQVKLIYFKFIQNGLK